MTHSPPLLVAQGIAKRFAGVRALKGVSLSVNAGEVLALVGENGAGKSTLMKILAGVESADEGELRVDGEIVHFAGVTDAQARGIALIHQELQLADNLDVAENIFLGREPRRGLFRDKPKMDRDAVVLLEQLGLRIAPTTRVANLAIGHQQMIEIAKALACDARVLIMDEPTSSLTLHETEQLFRVVKDLRSRGVAVIYISHRLGEVKELADRAVVLRDGENAGELARDEISHDSLVRLMVGRDVSRLFERAPRTATTDALVVRGLCTRKHPAHTVSFTVKTGEIVGIAGLVGAGRSEVLNAIFGTDSRLAGEIVVAGRALSLRGGARDARELGLGLVP
jgi:ribose transport system ATP-binding protein